MSVQVPELLCTVVVAVPGPLQISEDKIPSVTRLLPSPDPLSVLPAPGVLVSALFGTSAPRATRKCLSINHALPASAACKVLRKQGVLVS